MRKKEEDCPPPAHLTLDGNLPLEGIKHWMGEVAPQCTEISMANIRTLAINNDVMIISRGGKFYVYLDNRGRCFSTR